MNLVQKINEFYKLAVLSDEEFSKLNDFTTPEAEEYLKHKEMESENKIKNDLKSFIELSNKLFVNYFAQEYDYQTTIIRDKQLGDIRTQNRNNVMSYISLDESNISPLADDLLNKLKEKQYSFKHSSLYSEKHADYAVDKFFEIFEEVYLEYIGKIIDLIIGCFGGIDDSKPTLEDMAKKNFNKLLDQRTLRIYVESIIRKFEFKQVELEKIEDWDL